MAEVVKKQPVVVLPIGSVEDHGTHLPLDTDNFQIWSFCEEAAKRADGGILLMPLVPYGFQTHHLDFFRSARRRRPFIGAGSERRLTGLGGRSRPVGGNMFFVHKTETKKSDSRTVAHS